MILIVMFHVLLQGLPKYGECYEAKALGSSKKEKSMPGDWNCKSCRHLNFYWRQSCRRCQEARPEGVGSGTSDVRQRQNRILTFGQIRDFRPGDWFCNVHICGFQNFARRHICLKCGAIKNVPSFGGVYYNPVYCPMNFGFFHARRGNRISRRGWKPGDWFCGRPECNAHNYGSRMKCDKCDSSRELVNNVSN